LGGVASTTGALPEEVRMLEENAGHFSAPHPHQASVWTSTSNSAVPVPVPERMQNYFRKYNKVLLECIAIDRERERLELENAQLEELVKQYLDGTKISNEILAEDNPLFVVNGR
jgi:hypothetical protein